jgi:dTDP-glucose 4,6-dehydratase
MKTYLITGGAGFIGSWLVRFILKNRTDVRVINLDLLTYAGNLDNLADVANDPRYRFVHGDIRDKELVQSLMAETDVVVNAAAQTHVDRSISGPEEFTSTNVMGTQVLLEAARQAGIEKYVQISTDEVYGSLGPDGYFTESTPLDPSSPYSASKAAADMLALSYHKTFGLNVCVTRCSNNYGPNQYPEKLIPFFILKARADEPVPVYGDGQNVRDWIYVEDHNAAVLQVIEQGRAGEVYNIGASNEWKNIDITRKILSLMGKPDSLITYVTDRLGHDRRYAIDSRKIQTELGWSSQMDFAQGLALTIDWYQQNPTWLNNVLNRQGALVSA